MAQQPALNLPALHELEAEVMEVVWDLPPQTTVRAVMEALNERAAKQRAYTTIMTIMSRLARKGVLTRERVGKTDMYTPVVSREEYAALRAQAEVGSLVQEYGEHALVGFAREMAKLDPDRRRTLTRLARRRA